MTAICLPKPTGRYARIADLFTPGASRESEGARRGWIESASEHAASTDRSLDELLNASLWSAAKAVQQQSRYIAESDRKSIINQLARLLSREYWDDDDAILRIASFRIMLRVIIALGRGSGELTISRAGNLVSTWSVADHVLRVEALSEGNVAWTVLHPRGSAPRHQHEASDSIDNLKGILEQISG